MEEISKGSTCVRSIHVISEALWLRQRLWFWCEYRKAAGYFFP